MAGVGGVARPNRAGEPDKGPGRWTNTAISHRALVLPENGSCFTRAFFQGRHFPLFYFRTILKFSPSPLNRTDLIPERPWAVSPN